MHSWGDVERLRPDAAAQAAELLYAFGVGLAFLGTVRPDGGPRLHPICPLLCDGGLYAFIVPSPKRADLLRDGRYALHSFPPVANEDAAYLTGMARPAPDPSLRVRLSEQFVAERAALGVKPPADTEQVFAFYVDSLLLTRTTGHGDPAPVHTVWRATGTG